MKTKLQEKYNSRVPKDFPKKDFVLLGESKKWREKKKKVMQMRVEKIRSYLLENMEDKELIERIEKAINERRKV